MRVKIIIAAHAPSQARHFIEKTFGVRPTLTGDFRIVHDSSTMDQIQGLDRDIPWLLMNGVDRRVVDALVTMFGAPATKLPIDLAPRDGRQIMLIGQSGYQAPYNEHQETGHWRAVENWKEGGQWETDSHDGYTDGWPEPSHWWPLAPAR